MFLNEGGGDLVVLTFCMIIAQLKKEKTCPLALTVFPL